MRVIYTSKGMSKSLGCALSIKNTVVSERFTNCINDTDHNCDAVRHWALGCPHNWGLKLGIYWNFRIAVTYDFGICKRCNCDGGTCNGSLASRALYVINFRIMNQSLACTLIRNTSTYTWHMVTYISGEEIIFSIFLFIYEVNRTSYFGRLISIRNFIKPQNLTVRLIWPCVAL
jgi:hypothetical protein